MARPRFSEATIISISKTTLANGRKTVDGLSAFGINTEFLTSHENDIKAAEAMPTETGNRITLRDLTHSKDDVLETCVLWGQNLRTRLEIAFGRKSSELQAFPAKEFKAATKSENIMMPLMKTLLDIANKHEDALTAAGQTPEILSRGADLLESLREADLEQEVNKVEKNQATQERYQVFKKCYDTVNRINKVGRLVYRGDPVKLALFESKWPSAQKAQAEEGTLDEE